MKLLKFAFAIVLGSAFMAVAKVESKPFEVKEGYIFQPTKGSNATAGYGLLKNISTKEIKITVVSADGFKAVELHETVAEKGMMKMKKVESIQLSKDGTFELKPGGNHIMLFDPTKEFKDGDLIRVTFDVDKNQVTIPFAIKPRATAPHGHH